MSENKIENESKREKIIISTRSMKYYKPRTNSERPNVLLRSRNFPQGIYVVVR